MKKKISRLKKNVVDEQRRSRMEEKKESMSLPGHHSLGCYVCSLRFVASIASRLQMLQFLLQVDFFTLIWFFRAGYLREIFSLNQEMASFDGIEVPWGRSSQLSFNQLSVKTQ